MAYRSRKITVRKLSAILGKIDPTVRDQVLRSIEKNGASGEAKLDKKVRKRIEAALDKEGLVGVYFSAARKISLISAKYITVKRWNFQDPTILKKAVALAARENGGSNDGIIGKGNKAVPGIAQTKSIRLRVGTGV